jgi:acetoin utilization deacetylase AcuC-like enzyme
MNLSRDTGGRDLIPFVWDDACLAHDPDAEIWLGVRTPSTESAERARRIRAELLSAGHREIPMSMHDDDVLRRVHDAALLEYLEGAYGAWDAAGYRSDPGQDRVVPYFFPGPDVLHGLPRREPVAPHARAGYFCYDTMTLIGPGTWAAARGAVAVAETAAMLVAAATCRVAFALCRPPGHHATRAAFGGSCYLNNAAVAAESLRLAGHDRVAIIDIDAHHGNGTQALFYERSDVTYASVHVDPAAGWFPHVVGFAEETGRGPGVGSNLNLPLAPGSGDPEWLDAISQAVGAAVGSGVTALVVSLGVDAAVDDPESPLRVSVGGYRQAGELLGGLGIPTVAVLEGGYHLPSLGGLVTSTLAGLGA